MNELHKEVAACAAKSRYNTLFHLLRREYTKKGRPLKGTFELTPHCTLDCKMCYVHAPSGNYPGRVMTGDEWIHIIDAAVDAGMLYAVLTGGECMVHPDFRRVYTHLKERGVFTAILSNGTLLDEEMVSFLRSSPPRFIRISVYGSCPEVYERVTGCGRAFHTVDRALNLLHEAGIVTDISVTVSRYNYEDFENLLSYVQSKPHANLSIDCDMQEPRSETGRKLATFALGIEEQERSLASLF
ncbi:MAG: radical SAM protein [Oscillospiraceae bacterium]